LFSTSSLLTCYIQATILSKATEYIAHLERRSNALRQENNGLKASIDAFEIMGLARPCPRDHGPRAPGRGVETECGNGDKEGRDW
jgi:hypothetical protein